MASLEAIESGKRLRNRSHRLGAPPEVPGLSKWLRNPPAHGADIDGLLKQVPGYMEAARAVSRALYFRAGAFEPRP